MRRRQKKYCSNGPDAKLHSILHCLSRWGKYTLSVQRIGLVGITNPLIAVSTLVLLPILTKTQSIADYVSCRQQIYLERSVRVSILSKCSYYSGIPLGSQTYSILIALAASIYLGISFLLRGFTVQEMFFWNIFKEQ